VVAEGIVVRFADRVVQVLAPGGDREVVAQGSRLDPAVEQPLHHREVADRVEARGAVQGVPILQAVQRPRLVRPGQMRRRPIDQLAAAPLGPCKDTAADAPAAMGRIDDAVQLRPGRPDGIRPHEGQAVGDECARLVE
jgi:hypothetical protein